MPSTRRRLALRIASDGGIHALRAALGRLDGDGGIHALRAVLGRLDSEAIEVEGLSARGADLVDVFLSLTSHRDDERTPTP